MTGLELKYFVLKPKGNTSYSKASRIAMLAYATAIENENVKLAEEIRAWIADESIECDKPIQNF